MTRKSSGLFLLVLLPLSLAQTPSLMPRIEGQTLAGSQVVLPEAATGKVAVLVLGFTRASKTPTSKWAKQIRVDFGNQHRLELYQIPVLQDVLHVLRGMVISGIRKGVPENQRDHFLIVVQSESELKKFVGYKEPDDAYLVILSQDGKVAQQMHGLPEPEAYSRLKEKLASLLTVRG